MKRKRPSGITAEEFFKKVAINSRTADLETVRGVFYGMVKTISKELLARNVVNLPDWGEFSLKIHKSRNVGNLKGGKRTLPPKPMVKFIPDYKVRRYFHSLWEEGTVIK